jgi:RNA polymerase sigma-70 factor (ECF subfamily)
VALQALELPTWPGQSRPSGAGRGPTDGARAAERAAVEPFGETAEDPVSGVRAVVPRPGGEAAIPTRAGEGDRLGTVSGPLELDQLVKRSQAGDAVAFAELFRRHKGDVARLVFRMLGPSADAEDVVQEVFLQVHKSLGEFRGQAKFTTWLHRVTVNVVLMVRRAARSRPVFSGEPLADHEPDRRLLPDEDSARLARIAAFRRLLDRLPDKKRTVFVLHELEGIAPAEIAEIVGAPVLTVRTRLFYARRELADMMRDEPHLAQLARDLADEEKAPQGAREPESGDRPSPAASPSASAPPQTPKRRIGGTELS